MLTYEYGCEACGLKFERRRAITQRPITECPECRGTVRQLITGGAGFLLKSSLNRRKGAAGTECSLERVGETCCVRSERCGKPPCRD
jgi:putative FmdB family regulatory protein